MLFSIFTACWIIHKKFVSGATSVSLEDVIAEIRQWRITALEYLQ